MTSILSTREALQTVLDHVDYTVSNCRQNEAVGAVLPLVVIQNARIALDQLCAWKYNIRHDYWKTDCGNTIVLCEDDELVPDGTMQFCLFCGWPLAYQEQS